MSATIESVLTTALLTVGVPVYPIKMPRDNLSFPLMTYQLVSAPRIHTQDGAIASTSSRYQVDCWGENVTDARTTARSVVDALVAIAHTPLDVRMVTIPNEQEFHEPEQDLYRRMIEVILVTQPQEA